MSKSGKRIILASAGVIMLLCVAVCAYFYWDYGTSHRFSASDYKEYPNAEYSLSIAESSPDYYYAVGWVAVKDYFPAFFHTQLVLYYEDSSEMLRFPMNLREDASITQVMNDGIDHSSAGFERNIKKKHLEDQTCLVGFLFDLDQTEMLVKTGRPLSDFLG